MSKHTFTAIIVSLTLTTTLSAADPGASIAVARQRLASRDYDAALQLLHLALPDADAITSLKERVAAVSTIHFLSAMALTELGRMDEASAALRTFFHYRPRVKLDGKHYSARFAQLFDDTNQAMSREAPDRGAFSEHYPGFELVRPVEVASDVLWASSTAFQLLATPAEKVEWNTLTSDAARHQFVADFWKRRDPDPETTENATRDLILRRVQFADYMFAGGENRGSLSDRGEVFVLLGAPHRIVVRPLDQYEARFMPRRRGAGSGAVELWEYRPEQLPKKALDRATSFRFVSDVGTDARLLQRDFYTTSAMGAAKEVFQGGAQR